MAVAPKSLQSLQRSSVLGLGFRVGPQELCRNNRLRERGKHEDRVIVEIPVDDKPEQTT